MARKPGRMYKNFSGPAYTRREYMGGVPGVKVTQFDMGNLTDELPIAVTLVVNETCQIRHNALEAARVSANRYLMSDVGKQNYRFKVRVYPHQVLRENKQATGAGADRVSDGMRRAFGKAVGTAARVYRGQGIFTIYTNRENFEKAKEALRRAGHKLPTPHRLVVEKGAELVK
jgi:large subunit ribosomal protein L10e